MISYNRGEQENREGRPKPAKKKGKRFKGCQDLNPDKQTEIKQTGAKTNNSSVDNDPYPWLDPDDPRRTMSDSEIIRKLVTLDESELNDKQKEETYKLCEKYRDAFSLRDEIGECTDLEIELELKDDSCFSLRP